MNADAAKAELRARMLARLRALPREYVRGCSEWLIGTLRPLIDTPEQLRVFLYAALPHEVRLLPLLTLFPQHAYYFPRCLPGHRLAFHRVVHAERELVPGAMNIPTPLPHLPTLPAAEADIVIVPGLAFTLEGDRLGYGGGYYDRLLASLPHGIPTLALALSEQILPTLPTDEHDARCTVYHLNPHLSREN